MVSKTEHHLQQERRRREDRAADEERRRPTTFVHGYPSPEHLAALGPLVVASWSLPHRLVEKLQKQGRPVPQPVTGALLIDTGATKTSVSEKAAGDLALKPLRLSSTYGAGGKHRLPVYFARLSIRISSDTATTQLDYELEAMAIKDLERISQQLGIAKGSKEMQVIGLLGRDVLRHAQFTYDGVNGVIKVAFDRGLLREISGNTADPASNGKGTVNLGA